MRIEYLPRARLDLLDMGDHYRGVGGNTLARRMVSGVKAEIDLLCENPGIAPPYEIAPGIRRMVVVSGAFLVFYGVTDRIEVLHIRRAEREPVTAEELEKTD